MSIAVADSPINSVAEQIRHLSRELASPGSAANAVEIGNLLALAQSKLQRGQEWSQWVAEVCQLKLDWAYRLMKAARFYNEQDQATRSDLAAGTIANLQGVMSQATKPMTICYRCPHCKTDHKAEIKIGAKVIFLCKSCGKESVFRCRRNLTGQEFGRATSKVYLGQGRWCCSCNGRSKHRSKYCKEVFETATAMLVSGDKQSCKCLQRDESAKKCLTAPELVRRFEDNKEKKGPGSDGKVHTWWSCRVVAEELHVHANMVPRLGFETKEFNDFSGPQKYYRADQAADYRDKNKQRKVFPDHLGYTEKRKAAKGLEISVIDLWAILSSVGYEFEKIKSKTHRRLNRGAKSVRRAYVLDAAIESVKEVLKDVDADLTKLGSKPTKRQRMQMAKRLISERRRDFKKRNQDAKDKIREQGPQGSTNANGSSPGNGAPAIDETGSYPLPRSLTKGRVKANGALVSADSGTSSLTAEERAIQIFLRDPNQSIRAIAKKVGCDQSHLSGNRSPKFAALRRNFAGTLPKGSKGKDGVIEAERDEW